MPKVRSPLICALFFALAPVAHAQLPARAANGQFIGSPPLPPSSFDCSVDGSVVNALTGEPLARAHVSLSGPTSATTATDASGNWSFANVACMNAPVVVNRVGFLQRAMRLPPLQTGAPVHAVKVELTPQSVIYGKVIDDQGDSVNGIQIAVLASRVLNGRARFQGPSIATTNDLGEYRVANLGRGKYIVCTNVVNGVRAAGPTFADACYPGPVEGGDASAMDLLPGRETKVDFTLNPAQIAHVRGSVSGVPENRGVGINFVKRNATGFNSNVSAPVRDGKFDAQVPPGSYVVSADYFEAGKHLLARLPLEVGGADIENVAVVLDSGFTVTGNVHFSSQSGRTPQQTQFGINLRTPESNTGAGQLKWEKDRTSFALTDVVSGTYRLDTFPPAPFYVKSATLAGQDILNADFSVSQAAGPIEITLSDDSGSIEGDIFDSDGQPATGSVIALRNGKATIPPPGTHFKLQNLAPGDYEVYAWDDSSQVEYADPDWMKRYAGAAVTVTVASGQTAQTKLTLQKVPQ